MARARSSFVLVTHRKRTRLCVPVPLSAMLLPTVSLVEASKRGSGLIEWLKISMPALALLAFQLLGSLWLAEMQATLRSFPVAGTYQLWVRGKGTENGGSLIKPHSDRISILGNSWCSVKAEALEAGPRSGMESVELMGIEWSWRRCFLQGEAGGLIDQSPEHFHLTKCRVPRRHYHIGPYKPLPSAIKLLCLFCSVPLGWVSKGDLWEYQPCCNETHEALLTAGTRMHGCEKKMLGIRTACPTRFLLTLENPCLLPAG